eukprot:5838905-Alexandrium_andersonii.AAC.1
MVQRRVSEDLPGDRPRVRAENVVLNRVESMASPAQYTGPILLEAASSRAAIPEHREVRKAHPGRKVLEDELEVASRP